MTITLAGLSALANGDIENFIAASMPGGIERQEAQGQQTFVNSSTLPKDCMGNTRAELEAAGVKFGADADDIFVNVELPAGWKKVPTDHSMWSDLVDDKGRMRASIFYKAAFYDRNAHISTRCRYSYNQYEPCDANGNMVQFDPRTRPSHYATVITDAGKLVHVIGFTGADDFDSYDNLAKQAKAWLEEHYPDYANANAYWD